MARALPVCAVLVLLCVWGLCPESGASHKGDGRPGGRGPLKNKNYARPLRWNPRRSGGSVRAVAISVPGMQDYAQPAPNVALQGIATQSSTNSYFGYAQNANDGSLAANYLRSQCSYTKSELDPWWMVDLKAPYKIMSVAVTNRVLECCRERIFGAEIRIGNNLTNGGKQNPRCGVISSIESGETLSFSCQGMVGQYVTVTIPGREENLVLCEVQVYGLPADGSERATPKDLKTPNGAPNVALKGIAQQSSLYNMYGEAKHAIDGSLDSNYLYIQCAGTFEQEDPWWMVDLKSTFKVFTVAVTNRGDCCSERIKGAEIRIGNSAENGGTQNPICGVISSMGYGQTLAFECDGMVGQYVTVFIPGAERSVTICEVQVFGLPSEDTDIQVAEAVVVVSEEDVADEFSTVDDKYQDIWSLLLDLFDDDSQEIVVPEPEGENLAFRGITSQSSTYDKFGASENAIDGSTSVVYMSGHCSHTDMDVEPWWRVDLLSTYNITKVKIKNRGDCCQERINGAEIRIGNSREKGGNRNPRCAKIKSLGLGKEEEYVCGMVGQYITVTIPGRAGYLTLCEVKVYGTNVSEGYTAPEVKTEFNSEEHDHATELRNVLKHSNAAPNVAMTATATQSTTDGEVASNAIDGDLEKCSKTSAEDHPWWTLDLGSDHKVFSIAVTSGSNSSAQDLQGAEIHVGFSATGWKKNPICGTISSIQPEETFSFNCNGLEGRFVTIVIPHKASTLSLCEVQVFALSVDTPTGDWNGDFEVQKNHHGVKNVAPQGIPAQSSYYGSRSEVLRVIDGSLSNNYLAGECTHTRKEMGPWWNLDLNTPYRISSVAITNRGDCCRERINGAEIHIGNSAEDGGIRNPRCGVIFRMNYGETLSFNCKGMEGRYVTIVIPDQNQYLSLCEVQVFGELSETSPKVKEELTEIPPTVMGKEDSPGVPPAATDLRSRYFRFPRESNTDYVVLTPAETMRLTAFTLCMNVSLNVSDNRETILFSYRTTYFDELNLWLEMNGDLGFYMSGEGLMFPKFDKSKEWNHICLTWESKNGRCELWANGKRIGNKVYRKGHTVRPDGMVILGQDQDQFGEGFDTAQSYVGRIKDVNMWKKVLSLKVLRSVFKGEETRKGTIFDWGNLSYDLKGDVQLV
ncbi:uncharacterized protein [Dendrobates tinctorius]|uniref:uncharacterized protein isoform X1 n=1 Tax=Dendrobates tinctorius TaxID=92724 RepID=UPI003CCA37F7